MNMKEHILTAMKEELNLWEELLASMSDEQITAPLLPSNWSTKDVIAHLRAWQQVSIARLEAALLNTDPELPAWLGGVDPFYAEEHADDFNARVFEIHLGDSWSTLHGDWRDGFLRFLQMAEAISDTMMFDTQRFSWLGGCGLSAVLEGSHDHHQEHREKLLAWLREYGKT